MADQNLPPLDWRVPIVHSDGTPTDAFERAWNNQRTLNGGAVVDFTDLADVPSAYTTKAGYAVRVNAGASGLEFATQSTMLDGIGLTRGAILERGASGWQIISPGAANTLLTSAGAGSDPAWQALSAIIDAAIGSTRGAVLFRGASGWAILGPGTAGNFLQTAGAGADPLWAAASGGSGFNYFLPTNPSAPTTANMTLTNGGGANAGIGNLTGGRGLTHNIFNNVGGQTCSYASLNGYTPPAAGTDFSAQVTMGINSSFDGAWACGFAFADNTGKLQMLGIRNTTLVDFRMNNVATNSFNSSNAFGAGNPRFTPSPMTWRIRRTGAQFIAGFAFDGENFAEWFAVSSTAFLGAALASIGTFMLINGGPNICMSIYDFRHSP